MHAPSTQKSHVQMQGDWIDIIVKLLRGTDSAVKLFERLTKAYFVFNRKTVAAIGLNNHAGPEQLQ